MHFPQYKGDMCPFATSQNDHLGIAGYGGYLLGHCQSWPLACLRLSERIWVLHCGKVSWIGPIIEPCNFSHL